MIGDVEAVVVDPDRVALAGNFREPLPEARHPAEAGRNGAADAPDVETTPFVAERPFVEDQYAAHVHVVVGILELEKRCVEGGQALVVGHGTTSGTGPSGYP